MRSLLKYWLPLLIWLSVIFVGSTSLSSVWALGAVTCWPIGLVQPVAQSAANTQPSQTLTAPVITAAPEYVTVAGDSGSTEIQWDTGNGSVGFVFVTGTDQKPRLFASGPKGSQRVPWIQAA